MQPSSPDALRFESEIVNQSAIANQPAIVNQDAVAHRVTLLSGPLPSLWNQGDLDVVRARHRRQNRVPKETLYGTARSLYAVSHPNRAFLESLTNSSEADSILKIVREGVGVDVSELSTALLLSSLPETYAHADIALLLTKTKELVKPDRVKGRLQMTGQIIQSILSGLTSPDGHGLFKAFVELGRRHESLDLRYSETSETHIHDINQVSLAYTLLTFSFTPLLAITRARQGNFSDDERLKWLRMWNVVGSLMGIEPGGLPDSLAAAENLLTAVKHSEPYGRTGKTGDVHADAITLMGALIKPKRWEAYTQWADPDLVAHLDFHPAAPKE
jgi:hypothetical protein